MKGNKGNTNLRVAVQMEEKIEFALLKDISGSEKL